MLRFAPAAARGFAFWASLVFVLLATLGVLKGGSFAALGIAGGLLTALCASLASGRWAYPATRLAVPVAVFLIVVGALAPFADRPTETWLEELRLASVLIPLLLWTSPEGIDRLARLALWPKWPWLLLGGFLLAALVMASLRAQGDEYHLAKYNRGVSYGFLLVWPALCFVLETKKRALFALFLAALVPALALTHSRAAQLGMGIGGGVWLLVRLWPVWGPRLLGGVALVASAWPFAAQSLFLHKMDWVAKLPDSWRARVEIWDYMSYRIEEAPFFGHGLGAGYAQPFAEPHGALYRFTTQPAAHPHNFFVQLWVDFGGFGALFGVVFLIAVLREIRRLPASLASWAYGAWGCGVVLMLSAYDFWADSFLAALFLTGLLFAVLARRTGRN